MRNAPDRSAVPGARTVPAGAVLAPATGARRIYLQTPLVWVAAKPGRFGSIAAVPARTQTAAAAAVCVRERALGASWGSLRIMDLSSSLPDSPRRHVCNPGCSAFVPPRLVGQAAWMARSERIARSVVVGERPARGRRASRQGIPVDAAGARLRRAVQRFDKHREASRSVEHGVEIRTRDNNSYRESKRPVVSEGHREAVRRHDERSLDTETTARAPGSDGARQRRASLPAGWKRDPRSPGSRTPAVRGVGPTAFRRSWRAQGGQPRQASRAEAPEGGPSSRPANDTRCATMTVDESNGTCTRGRADNGTRTSRRLAMAVALVCALAAATVWDCKARNRGLGRALTQLIHIHGLCGATG